MPINVTAALRRALRQLEAEQTRVGHQISALRGALGDIDTSRGISRSRARRSASTRRGRRRRRLSAAARRAVSQRMRAYWAKRKAARAKGKPKGAKAK